MFVTLLIWTFKNRVKRNITRLNSVICLILLDIIQMLNLIASDEIILFIYSCLFFLYYVRSSFIIVCVDFIFKQLPNWLLLLDSKSPFKSKLNEWPVLELVILSVGGVRVGQTQ